MNGQSNNTTITHTQINEKQNEGRNGKNRNEHQTTKRAYFLSDTPKVIMYVIFVVGGMNGKIKSFWLLFFASPKSTTFSRLSFRLHDFSTVWILSHVLLFYTKFAVVWFWFFFSSATANHISDVKYTGLHWEHYANYRVYHQFIPLPLSPFMCSVVLFFGSQLISAQKLQHKNLIL